MCSDICSVVMVYKIGIHKSWITVLDHKLWPVCISINSEFQHYAYNCIEWITINKEIGLNISACMLVLLYIYILYSCTCFWIMIENVMPLFSYIPGLVLQLRTFLIRNGLSLLFDEGFAAYRKYYLRFVYSFRVWNKNFQITSSK